MADPAHLRVSDDLDAIRRSLASDDPLTPALARFVAACGGTLRRVRVERPSGPRPRAVVVPEPTSGRIS